MTKSTLGLIILSLISCDRNVTARDAARDVPELKQIVEPYSQLAVIACDIHRLDTHIIHSLSYDATAELERKGYSHYRVIYSCFYDGNMTFRFCSKYTL